MPLQLTDIPARPKLMLALLAYVGDGKSGLNQVFGSTANAAAALAKGLHEFGYDGTLYRMTKFPTQKMLRFLASQRTTLESQGLYSFTNNYARGTDVGFLSSFVASGFNNVLVRVEARGFDVYEALDSETLRSQFLDWWAAHVATDPTVRQMLKDAVVGKRVRHLSGLRLGQREATAVFSCIENDRIRSEFDLVTFARLTAIAVPDLEGIDFGYIAHESEVLVIPPVEVTLDNAIEHLRKFERGDTMPVSLTIDAAAIIAKKPLLLSRLLQLIQVPDHVVRAIRKGIPGWSKEVVLGWQDHRYSTGVPYQIVYRKGDQIVAHTTKGFTTDEVALLLPPGSASKPFVAEDWKQQHPEVYQYARAVKTGLVTRPQR